MLDRVPGAGTAGVKYFRSGDVQDLGQVFEAVVGCDAVIHLAGDNTILQRRNDQIHL